MTRKIDWNYLFVGLLAAVFFLPRLGHTHLFDWDEINFAECAREMLVSGSYLRPQINFEPFWEKPPLFIWLQVLSMKIWGINAYAARFPNAVCGIVTLVLLYHFGKKIYNKTFGWFWVLSYWGAILPHLYFKSGIIDPWFNLFMFLSVVFLYHLETAAADNRPYRHYILGAGIFAGLAILTKGPAGFLIISLTWFIKLLYYKEFSLGAFKRYFNVGLVALVTALSWFGAELVQNGFWFINEFIVYNIRLAKTEDAGHGGFVGYHFVVLLLGCFPASVLALRTLVRPYNVFGEKVDLTRWMKILFWVVLIVFSLVQSKIVHYSSMCYFPLSFMSALTLKSMCEDNVFHTYLKRPMWWMGGLIVGVVLVLPWAGQNIEVLKPLFQKDKFALANLNAVVEWTAAHYMPGLFLLLGLLGWSFSLKKYGILRGGIVLFASTALFLQLALYFFVNNIEAYSQRAAIEFYQSKVGEDCYIRTYGYKSYAPFFYAEKRPPQNPNHSREAWLLEGAVDRPTYFVGKITVKKELDAKPTLQFLYEKNGFVFYKRR